MAYDETLGTDEPQVWPCEVGANDRLHVSFQVPDNLDIRDLVRMRTQKEVHAEAGSATRSDLVEGKNFWSHKKVELDPLPFDGLVLTGAYYDEKDNPKDTSKDLRLVVSFWFTRNIEHRLPVEETVAMIAFDMLMLAAPAADDPEAVRTSIWDYADVYANNGSISCVLKGISCARSPGTIIRVTEPQKKERVLVNPFGPINSANALSHIAANRNLLK